MIWILIVSLVGVLITGLIRVFRWLQELKSDIDFIALFHNKFIQLADGFVNQQAVNPELYHWLISHSLEAQEVMGKIGQVHYRGVYHEYNIPNYQVILNTIPNIRTGLAEKQDIAMCDDALIRFMGYRQSAHQANLKKLFNPIIWFQYGVQFYVGLPIRLLYWFGIIGQNTFNKATSNQVFTLLSGLVGLATFLAAIVAIILGWDKAKEFFLGLF